MSKSLFQRLGLLAATALTAVTLVACGGGSSAPTKVVALADLNLPINTSNKAAAFEMLTAAKDGYTFANGLTLGANTVPGPVKITLGGADADNMTYTMVDGNNVTSTGTFKFGSCIIDIATGAYAGSYTINNCSINVPLKGKTLTTNTAFSGFYVWLVATFQSNQFFSAYEGLRIDASGNVTYVTTSGASIPLGNVAVTAPTGATGGTGSN